MFLCFVSSLLPFYPFPKFRKNLSANVESDGHSDPLAQTGDGPMAHPQSGRETNKKPSFPDEIELQNLLQKLSAHSLEMHNAAGLGDTDSLSSHTSG